MKILFPEVVESECTSSPTGIELFVDNATSKISYLSRYFMFKLGKKLKGGGNEPGVVVDVTGELKANRMIPKNGSYSELTKAQKSFLKSAGYMCETHAIMDTYYWTKKSVGVKLLKLVPNQLVNVRVQYEPAFSGGSAGFSNVGINESETKS